MPELSPQNTVLDTLQLKNFAMAPLAYKIVKCTLLLSGVAYPIKEVLTHQESAQRLPSLQLADSSRLQEPQAFLFPCCTLVIVGFGILNHLFCPIIHGGHVPPTSTPDCKTQ